MSRNQSELRALAIAAEKAFQDLNLDHKTMSFEACVSDTDDDTIELRMNQNHDFVTGGILTLKSLLAGATVSDEGSLEFYESRDLWAVIDEDSEIISSEGAANVIVVIKCMVSAKAEDGLLRNPFMDWKPLILSNIESMKRLLDHLMLKIAQLNKSFLDEHASLLKVLEGSEPLTHGEHEILERAVDHFAAMKDNTDDDDLIEDCNKWLASIEQRIDRSIRRKKLMRL